MFLKKIIISIFILLCCDSYCQDNNSFSKTITYFIVKQRSYTSKKYADEINKINSEAQTGKWEGGFSGIINPPPPLPNEFPSNHKWFLNFTITPKYYIQYHFVDNNFESDTLYPAINYIKKISREDLSVTSFSPLWFTTKTEKLNKMNICNYNIITEYRNVKKNMSGYNCFKVILKNKTNPNYLIELFVTENIKLNYHPIVNCPNILDKYYPLYIKKYLKEYPNDNFNEYHFVKSAL